MTNYINFGSAVPTQRIGTAGGVLHRKAPELSKRPYCEHCGVRARYQRQVAKTAIAVASVMKKAIYISMSRYNLLQEDHAPCTA